MEVLSNSAENYHSHNYIYPKYQDLESNITKYVCKILPAIYIHTGKMDGDSELSCQEAILIELLTSYMSREHTLDIDNWYSFPAHFQEQLEAET
jgi:hypothetical protein